MAPEESAEAAPLLRSFERRFLAARALRSFPWQSLEEKLRDSSGSGLLLDILQKTVKHPLCVKHPPSVKYAWSFLSELIRKHEAIHTEPLDELYEALAEILMAEEPTRCHRSYLLPSGDSVTLSESTAIISHGTTGLVTWNAALYLAEWAMENPAGFAHRTVLELGSGAGLTGLAICKMCRPRAYVFSDCHSHVLEQLQGNVLLNGLSLEPNVTALAQHPGHDTADAESPRVTVAQVDWDVVTAPQLAAFQPDIVIAAGLHPAAHVGTTQRPPSWGPGGAPSSNLGFSSQMCCIAQKLSSPWLGSCRSSLPARRTSGLLTPTLPSPSATRRRVSCSPGSWAGLGSRGKKCLVTTRNCFPTKSTQRWQF
ncbi:protein-lysine N-methyltransferase EEF2KMT isoform X1 [Balaenoptera acutorostrata]|uniref:Protein-lysine N-methyltransferase EEF2KMT isoform X1 n=1 Tax=Balaenoptera acutorostrata TaxID=9767 RepID=A0ABM3S6N8_BALAC|nr:protein-lysine N-methyltransferase EEF2KMT isoform X1 [Balaenoptera acutorostrata]